MLDPQHPLDLARAIVAANYAEAQQIRAAA